MCEDEAWKFRIAKLELESGDVLVVKGQPPESHPPRSHEVLRACCPPGVRILYIPPEMELSVLTRAKIEEMAT
jgi:hypothetical protein